MPLSRETARRPETLLEDYVSTLQEFVGGAGERALVSAYELGRRAANAKVGLLDVVVLHQKVIDRLTCQGQLIDPMLATEFLTEVLSPYELTLRAYNENARLLGLGAAVSQKNSEIERSQLQLRTILDATTAVIYLRDVDGRFLFVNKRFEQLFGVHSDEVVGKLGQEILPASIETVLREGDRRALNLKSPQELEDSMDLASGDVVLLSLKVPLLDNAMIPYAVCSVATDISERQRSARAIQIAKDTVDEVNKALRATQAQLVQSAKMASLGELVAGIAHEINNPLSFALSHLTTARRNLGKLDGLIQSNLDPTSLESWQRAEDRLRELSTGLERIGELVLKLRTFSRVDEGELKVVKIRECIDSVAMILKHRLEGRIELEIAVDEGDAIECYPSLLNQALMNLIANAIEALPAPKSGRIAVRAQQSGDAYRIEVTDTGPGIPERVRERIFEPFFTTKAVGQGTGLGLSITYSIVERHGGTLKVHCPEEGGTVMTVSLPTNRAR